VRKDDFKVASLCPPAAQSGTSYNAISIGSREDWDEYLQKNHGKVTLVPSSSIVIKEIIEPVNLGSSDSGKEQALSAIEEFIPLVLALPIVVRSASSSI